ncbi:MAG: hypothetical protein ACFNUO_07050, partial [Capnocytophaga ochracea]
GNDGEDCLDDIKRECVHFNDELRMTNDDTRRKGSKKGAIKKAQADGLRFFTCYIYLFTMSFL